MGGPAFYAFHNCGRPHGSFQHRGAISGFFPRTPGPIPPGQRPAPQRSVVRRGGVVYRRTCCWTPKDTGNHRDAIEKIYGNREKLAGNRDFISTPAFTPYNGLEKLSPSATRPSLQATDLNDLRKRCAASGRHLAPFFAPLSVQPTNPLQTTGANRSRVPRAIPGTTLRVTATGLMWTICGSSAKGRDQRLEPEIKTTVCPPPLPGKLKGQVSAPNLAVLISSELIQERSLTEMPA